MLHPAVLAARRYNLVADLPDFRDYAYADHGPKVATPPDLIDLSGSKFISPVKDQGQIGSCTGNSIAGAAEFLRRMLGLSDTLYARLMIYYGERAYEHTTQQDSGAQIRDGIKFLAQFGVCAESEWPYVTSKFKKKPTAKCYKDALPNAIAKYARLGMAPAGQPAVAGQLQTDIVNCLGSGLPFVYGFSVYASFESDAVAKSGIVPMPGAKEKLMGGHAVYAIGVNVKTRMVRTRNSWGPSWGQGGDFWIPLDYLLNPNLASDFWAILP